MSKSSEFFTKVFSKIRKSFQPPNSKRRWLVVSSTVVVLAAVIGLTYYELVFLPRQRTAAAQPVMQTATVRRGDITLSASGTGTLVAANQVQLGFGSSGKLITLNVKVGDQVKAGQLLAAIDNSSQELQLAQAKQTMANLTSNVSIATAEKDLATSQANVYTTKNQLIYLVSPRVFYDQQQIDAAQQALDQDKAAASTPPTSDQQKAIDAATAKLTSYQNALSGDMVWYTQHYVKVTFTVMQRDPITHRAAKTVDAPTDADIATAKAAYQAALSSVQEAQWYLDALNGKTIPDNATGTNLSTFEQAKLSLDAAQQSLDGTQLYAPFDGVVTIVNNQLGDSVGSSPVIVIADLGQLYVKTYVDESDYAMFSVGNSATIVFDALPNVNLTGKVVEVDPSLASSNGTSAVSGMVALDPTSEKLLLGMSAAVNIIAGSAQNAVLVPVAALHQTTPGNYSVFVVRNGKLTVTQVTIGLQDVVNAEVKSGLQPGDIVSTGIVGTK